MRRKLFFDDQAFVTGWADDGLIRPVNLRGERKTEEGGLTAHHPGKQTDILASIDRSLIIRKCSAVLLASARGRKEKVMANTSLF